jgi:Protein of unknown function (DUF1579)
MASRKLLDPTDELAGFSAFHGTSRHNLAPKGERTMSHHETSTPEEQPMAQLPGPDPALRQLDRFVGTWQMAGRTLDSDRDNVTGRTSFEWLPGGHFLVQRFAADFMGMAIESLEVIGYDPATGTFPSTVYASMSPVPLPYRWEIDGDELKITAESLGATFHGRWNADGTEFSGGWRPDPGHESDPGNIPYDISGSRADS